MSAGEASIPDRKLIDDSKVTVSQLMQPEHANIHGDVHGGWIMKMCDEAGALAAMRHAQCRVVTVGIDQMRFHEPISIGDLVTMHSEVTYVGRTSMEVRVQVLAENPIAGVKVHTNTAYLVYVALDDNGLPKPVPGLIANTPEQERRMRDGAARQAYRLEQREKEALEGG